MTSPIERAAERLLAAARTGVPCPPVRDIIEPDDVAAAYAVQRRVTDTRLAGGARVVGRKIGLTSAAVQRQLGVAEPDFGVLFDDMDVSHLDSIPVGSIMQPRIEAEVAFVLGCDLADGPLTADAVRGAVSQAVAALEIVGSRIAGWDISLADTVADNASSGAFVLSDRRVALDAFEPAECVMTMTSASEVVSNGHGAACLGDPLAALAWLARTARDLGDPLRAGQVVLSGALGPMVPVTPGAEFTAEITGLGRVRANFDGGKR